MRKSSKRLALALIAISLIFFIIRIKIIYYKVLDSSDPLLIVESEPKDAEHLLKGPLIGADVEGPQLPNRYRYTSPAPNILPITFR